MANPQDAVHLHPDRRNKAHINGSMPFRIFYIAFRALIIAFEVAAMAYLAWILDSYPSRTNVYTCGLVAAILGMVLNALAIGVLVHKKDLSGLSGCCFNCLDVVVMIVAIVGSLWFLLADWNSEGFDPPEVWDDHETIGAFLIMGVALAHFFLSVINCVGSCVACGRAKRAKRRTEQVVHLVPVMELPPYTEATGRPTPDLVPVPEPPPYTEATVRATES